MSLLNAIFALVMFAFVSSITPGPNNLMLLASGTRFGFRRTVPHMLGVAIGFALMIALVGLGLARLFSLYPAAHVVLKIVSIVYLLYFAWKIANAPPPPVDAADDGARPMTFLQAAAFQWVNPKAWTMALTALSAYLPPTDPWLGLVIVSLVFGAVNLPSVSIWAAMGTQLRRFLHEPAKLRLFNRTAAVLLIASLYPVVVHG